MIERRVVHRRARGGGEVEVSRRSCHLVRRDVGRPASRAAPDSRMPARNRSTRRRFPHRPIHGIAAASRLRREPYGERFGEVFVRMFLRVPIRQVAHVLTAEGNRPVMSRSDGGTNRTYHATRAAGRADTHS